MSPFPTTAIPPTTWLSLWRGQIPRQRSFMASVAREVAEKHRLTLDDLRGPSRKRPVAWARQEFMCEALGLGRSTTAVGRFLNRHHSTVIFGARRHRERMA